MQFFGVCRIRDYQQVRIVHVLQLHFLAVDLLLLLVYSVLEFGDFSGLSGIGGAESLNEIEVFLSALFQALAHFTAGTLHELGLLLDFLHFNAHLFFFHVVEVDDFAEMHNLIIQFTHFVGVLNLKPVNVSQMMSVTNASLSLDDAPLATLVLALFGVAEHCFLKVT